MWYSKLGWCERLHRADLSPQPRVEFSVYDMCGGYRRSHRFLTRYDRTYHLDASEHLPGNRSKVIRKGVNITVLNHFVREILYLTLQISGFLAPETTTHVLCQAHQRCCSHTSTTTSSFSAQLQGAVSKGFVHRIQSSYLPFRCALTLYLNHRAKTC